MEDVGESVGSMGVLGGDVDFDLDIVGVVDLLVSFLVICLRKFEWELIFWNCFGGVFFFFMICIVWLFLLYMLFDLFLEGFWEEISCGCDICILDEIIVVFVGNGIDEFILWCILGEWGGELEFILFFLFCGVVGNLVFLRRIKI